MMMMRAADDGQNKKKNKNKKKKRRRKKEKEASKGYLPRRFKKWFFSEMLQEIVKQLRPKKSDFVESQRKEKEKENSKRRKKREKRKKRKKEKMKTEKRKKKKKGGCRNDKVGPLENVHFCLENSGKPPSNVWFSWEHSAFSGCDYSLRELGEPPCEPQGGSPFSLGEGQTFSAVGALYGTQLFLQDLRLSSVASVLSTHEAWSDIRRGTISALGRWRRRHTFLPNPAISWKVAFDFYTFRNPVRSWSSSS